VKSGSWQTAAQIVTEKERDEIVHVMLPSKFTWNSGGTAAGE